MARRGPAAGVAGLYPGPAAPGVRDESPAPLRQRHVAARLRCADGAERGRRGADADHGAGCPDRLGAQPGVPPRAADKRVTEVALTGRGRQAQEDAAPGHVDLVRRLFFGGLPEGLVGPLGEALESVYANIIKQGSLPPPVDWHPAED